MRHNTYVATPLPADDQERFNLTDSIAAVFEDWPKELSDIHDFFPESASWQLRTLDNDTKTLFHECVRA